MVLTRRQWMAAAVAAPAFCASEYWPKSDWETISAKDASAERGALEDALTFAGDRASTGVVILRHGRILAERYWRDWTRTTAQPIYSASKSVTATLIGMAIDTGKIRNVEQPVSDFIPSWKSTPKSQITIRHLLTMTSGLAGNTHQNIAGESQFEFMTNAAQDHTPGKKWVYHTPAYRMLLTILHRATGEGPNAYTQRLLWGPLGMTN